MLHFPYRLFEQHELCAPFTQSLAREQAGWDSQVNKLFLCHSKVLSSKTLKNTFFPVLF